MMYPDQPNVVQWIQYDQGSDYTKNIKQSFLNSTGLRVSHKVATLNAIVVHSLNVSNGVLLKLLPFRWSSLIQNNAYIQKEA